MNYTYPGKRILRKMGYLKDQKGILERYLLEADHWEPHLAKTRNEVKSFVDITQPSEIIVMGSGWLLDFPLEEVYETCRNIFLLDIFHPPQIKKKVEKFPGVQCIPADLTGGMIDKAYKTGKLPSIENFNSKMEVPQKSGRVVVSLNVLNQLDILLVDAVKRKDHISPEEINTFRQFIQKAHIEVIAAFPSCLITDITELLINREGEEIERKDLIFTDLPEVSGQNSWIWAFDNHFSYNKGYNTHFEVTSRLLNIQ